MDRRSVLLTLLGGSIAVASDGALPIHPASLRSRPMLLTSSTRPKWNSLIPLPRQARSARPSASRTRSWSEAVLAPPARATAWLLSPPAPPLLPPSPVANRSVTDWWRSTFVRTCAGTDRNQCLLKLKVYEGGDYERCHLYRRLNRGGSGHPIVPRSSIGICLSMSGTDVVAQVSVNKEARSYV